MSPHSLGKKKKRHLNGNALFISFEYSKSVRPLWEKGEYIPLDLINSWSWHEFHKHRLYYRVSSYCNAEEGSVFVWGYGILGKGPNLTETAVPEMIPPSLFGWSDFSPDVRVARVRCGLSHFAALTSKFLVLLS